MTFDPQTFPLEADLSRADVRVLHRYCLDKSVVEFGCGGSTPLLVQFVYRLSSYDTDTSWIARTARRLAKDSISSVQIQPCREGVVPDELPKADVYFLDGHVPDRILWAKAVIVRNLAPIILMHDSRSSCMNDLGQLFVWPGLTLRLRSMEFHVEGSNMVLIRTDVPCEYVNWNEAEPENRLPFLGAV